MKLNSLEVVVIFWCKIDSFYFNGYINTASFKRLHLDDTHIWGLILESSGFWGMDYVSVCNTESLP